MATNGNAGPYIEFKDVSKAFGDNRVLDHVSFTVMPGETVCILGRSGVGKSVSLMNIMGFLKPDSGRVIVAHEDITDYGEDGSGAHSQEGHDSFPEWSFVRFFDRRRKRRIPACENGASFRKSRSIRLSMACWTWSASRRCATSCPRTCLPE